MKKALALLTATLLVTLFGVTPVGLADDINVTASVSSYLTVTFEYVEADFGNVSSGTTNNLPTNLDQTAGEINVTIDTNADYSADASGLDFSGPAALGIGNLSMDADATSPADLVADTLVLSTSPAQLITGTSADTINYHGYYLDIPTGQEAGSYNTTVTISYATV